MGVLETIGAAEGLFRAFGERLEDIDEVAAP